MAKQTKPSFTKIIIDNNNGLTDLSDFTAEKNDTVKITTSLREVIRSALNWSPLDLSDVTVIDGLTVTNFVTGEPAADAAEVIKKIKIDALSAAIDAGDEATIERLYKALTGSTVKTTTKDTSTSPKASGRKLEPHKRMAEHVTDGLRKQVAERMVYAFKNNLIPVALQPNKEADAGCYNITEKVVGLVPNDCAALAQAAYFQIVDDTILNNSKSRKVVMDSDVQTTAYFDKLADALTTKGYMTK